MRSTLAPLPLHVCGSHSVEHAFKCISEAHLRKVDYMDDAIAGIQVCRQHASEPSPEHPIRPFSLGNVQQYSADTPSLGLPCLREQHVCSAQQGA